MELKRIELTVEKGNDGLWGSIKYHDNLIADCGNDLADLENKIKKQLQEFEGLDIESIEFECTYDIFSLFQEFDFLNISKISKYAGINAGLLRQYASGVKHPSLNQAKKIEETLHRLAEQMKKASIVAG